MTRSIVTFPFTAPFAFSLPAPGPRHPLAARPPRLVWVILLVGWLAVLGWNAEQIGTLLLVVVHTGQPQEES